MKKKHRWEPRVFFMGGAAVAPEALRPGTEPADYDDFWNAQMAALEAVPIETEWDGKALLLDGTSQGGWQALMISTLKAMFQERRDLFEGLAIMDTDWDWEAERRPVIHLNMGKCAAADYETFAANLPGVVRRGLFEAGCGYDETSTPSANFGNAIDVLTARRASPSGPSASPSTARPASSRAASPRR